VAHRKVSNTIREERGIDHGKEQAVLGEFIGRTEVMWDLDITAAFLIHMTQSSGSEFVRGSMTVNISNYYILERNGGS
jgi:hypothetical protein